MEEEARHLHTSHHIIRIDHLRTAADLPVSRSRSAANRSPLLRQAASDELDELDPALEQAAGTRGSSGSGGGASGSASVAAASGSAAPSAGDGLPPGWIERSRRLPHIQTYTRMSRACACACTLSLSPSLSLSLRTSPSPPPSPAPSPSASASLAISIRLRLTPTQHAERPRNQGVPRARELRRLEPRSQGHRTLPQGRVAPARRGAARSPRSGAAGQGGAQARGAIAVRAAA